jgi:ketosteroid isomerase-like protein
VNIEQTMRRGYEAMSRGDTSTIFELLDPDVVMHDRPEAPDPQTYRGHAGVVEALQKNVDTFETLALEPERFERFGDWLVIVLRMHGRGRESGVPVEEHIAHLWKLRDERAHELQVYSDPDEALRVAAEKANVELVRSVYEAWMAGEVDRVAELLDPQLTWVEPPDAPESGTYRGPAGALHSTDAWIAGWEDYELELGDFVPAGDRVLVRARQRGRGRGSGVTVESNLFHVWTIRDGRAIRVEIHLAEQAALSAAGLDRQNRHH